MTQSSIDRMPPHSIEAEQGVLGCILLAPECLDDCVSQLKGGEAFYDLRHRTIYETLVAMHEDKRSIDLITVQQRLKDAGQLEAVGGLAYLAGLPDKTPSAANLGFYLPILQSKHIRRKLIQTGTSIVGKGFKEDDNEGDTSELLDAAEREILAIRQSGTGFGYTEPRPLVHRAIDLMEELQKRGGGLTGLGTGFADFDAMTSGLHPGELGIVAARPALGKTSFGMAVAAHVALDQKMPVGVFSLEMTAESLMLRVLCGRAEVNLRALELTGKIPEWKHREIVSASAALANAPLFIDDTAGLTIQELSARARRMHRERGIGLLVVDYLQLLTSSNRKSSNSRVLEIGDISRGLKLLSKELCIPVVALCQLSREIERRGGKPMLSDLRESGSIEQDADWVGMLYNESEPEDGASVVDVNLLIAKQRNGPTGDCWLTFKKQFTLFIDRIPTRLARRSPIDEADVPPTHAVHENQDHDED